MGNGMSRDSHSKNKYLKECLRKFDPNEIEVLHKIYKELARRSVSVGIEKEAFLQYFNLPGLWGEQLFRKFDINNSGAVELDEFMIGIAVSCRGTRSEKIFVLFKLFDLNNNNRIHKYDLLAMLSNFPRLTKYIFTSFDNGRPRSRAAETRFNTRNRNLKLHDRNDKLNSYLFDQFTALYKDFPHRADQSMFTFPLRTFSKDSVKSNSSNSVASAPERKDAALAGDLPNGKTPLSPANIAKLSTRDTPNNGAALEPTRRHTPGTPTHKQRFKRSGLKGHGYRTWSYHDQPDDRESPLNLSNRQLVDFYSDLSNPSFLSNDFETFPYTDSSRDSWNSIDMTDIYTASSDDPITAVVNAIIAEQEAYEENTHSDIDLKTLVNQILEECEFNETGSLCYDNFKAWVEKNDSILTIFSECLHEEVWGLKGHAFNHEEHAAADAKETRLVNGATRQESSSTDDSAELTAMIIYDAFLVKGKHPFTFTMDNDINEVVDEQLLDQMKQIDANKYTQIMQDGQAPMAHALDYPDREKATIEIFACPSCKTPFLMCPVCYKKHGVLSLVIETNNIYIKCAECCSANDNEIGVFKSCWICCWSFNELFTTCSITSRNGDRASPQYSPAISSDAIEPRHSGLESDAKSMISSKSGFSNKSVNLNATAKAGWMFKIGKTLHQWKSRYYVLVGNILYYYKDKESTRPRGCIFLEGCYLDTIRRRQIGNKYGFSIVHKGNRLSKRDLYVESEQEMQEWTELLSHAMKQQTPSNMYEICEKLGQGKFSIVYRGIFKPTGQEYAVKVIDKTKITHQERELLRCEISILKLLNHNHVIFLKEIIDMKDSLYIVMELVRGGELYDLIHTEHRLSEAHTHRIISQLLHTVAYLHRCGIIHRDLKPENLLLTDRSEEGSIKLTDFGLSTLCGPNDILMQPCGTLAYVAPEVLTMQGYNQKSDVWSIGVIMYLLLRGRLPFAIKKAQSINVWDHYRVNFEGTLWRSISSSAKDLIRKMLEIDPEKRLSVFEALDHIWVTNFVAVNYESKTTAKERITTESEEFYQTIRNTTDTTFVLPYSESYGRIMNTLNKVKARPEPAPFEPESDRTESTRRSGSKPPSLPTVQE